MCTDMDMVTVFFSVCLPLCFCPSLSFFLSLSLSLSLTLSLTVSLSLHTYTLYTHTHTDTPSPSRTDTHVSFVCHLVSTSLSSLSFSLYMNANSFVAVSWPCSVDHVNANDFRCSGCEFRGQFC